MPVYFDMLGLGTEMIPSNNLNFQQLMEAALIQSWEGIKAQGGRCMHNGSCAYRGPSCKCGVGQLIPDSSYRVCFDDGVGGFSLTDVYRSVGALHPLPLTFLKELQAAHDMSQNLVEMCGKFRQLALQINADPSKITMEGARDSDRLDY